MDGTLKAFFRRSYIIKTKTVLFEIRPAKEGVLFWTPETTAYLEQSEMKKLLELLCQIRDSEKFVSVRFKSPELEMKNANRYLDFSFIEHTGWRVGLKQMMLGKENLDSTINGLRTALSTLEQSA